MHISCYLSGRSKALLWTLAADQAEHEFHILGGVVQTVFIDEILYHLLGHILMRPVRHTT